MTLFYTGYNIILENEICQKDFPAGKLSDRQFIELQFMEVIIMRDWEKCTLHNVERKGTSYYGNPSYWIYFSDSEGHFHAGYTASNSSAGYTASNYKYCDEGQVIYLDYHFTKKKGTCIIDCIKHNSPTEATREAEGEKVEASF